VTLSVSSEAPESLLIFNLKLNNVGVVTFGAVNPAATEFWPDKMTVGPAICDQT
jgi:hypothetical protein